MFKVLENEYFFGVVFNFGVYIRGIDFNYVNKVFILVFKMVDDGKSMCVKYLKWKLRMKNEYNLWIVY